jgi:hypothetical protein
LEQKYYSEHYWNGNVQNEFWSFASAQLAGNYASNDVPNSYATELKIGYAARLFYADAFIANQNLQVALISSVKVRIISQPQS